MDMMKTGNFLKELRKAKGLTQEELAEEFNVTRRSVSRWETGFNMPDLDILMNLSDFYQVDLREILDGESKEKKMDKELEDTVKKVAEYSSEDKKRTTKILLVYFCISLALLIYNTVLEFVQIGTDFWYGFMKGATLGFAILTMVFGILYLTGQLTKLMKAKRRMMGWE